MLTRIKKYRRVVTLYRQAGRLQCEKWEICGVNTSALPKLTNEQSTQLLLQIKQGDKAAREKFINCNMRLVLAVVQRFSSRNANADDMFQIGCVGLIKAADNFNTDFGVRFSTYAVPMIEGEIRRYLRESNSLRVSRGVRDVAYRALQVRDRLEKESLCEVTVEHIAKEMDMPVFKVTYCLDAISDPVSLSEKVYGDEEDSLYLEDHIADERVSENAWVEKATLYAAIEALEQKERDILLKRYFEGKTQTEVSCEVGLSQAQVSRLEKRAIEQMRQQFIPS